jgi:hypothetical protein
VAVDVQHRFGGFGAHQRRTDVVDVEEVIHVVVAIGVCPGAAQFLQRGGPEGAEGKEAPRPQHAAHLGERGIRGLAPLQHEIAEHQVDAAAGQRQPGGVAAGPRKAPPQPLVVARLLEHPQGQIHRRRARG